MRSPASDARKTMMSASYSLDVLDVLRRPQVLQLLGLDDVTPRNLVTPLPNRVDERLVDDVLDARAGCIRRDGCELVDLVRRQAVIDLVEVTLVGPDPARLGGVAHLVDAVEPARPQEGLVERLRHV